MPLTTEQTQQLTGLTDGLARSGALMQEPALVRALSALTDAPEARQAAAADPAAFLRAQGVPLSKSARVTYTEVAIDDGVTRAASARRFTITVCDSVFVLGRQVVSICHTYDSETGWHTTIQVSL